MFAGADYNSLEDYVSALTTRDPNKIDVYTQGYDGHCLRAANYFASKMPDINVADEGERVFEVRIGDSIHYLKCGTLVSCPIRGTIPIEEYVDGVA